MSCVYSLDSLRSFILEIMVESDMMEDPKSHIYSRLNQVDYGIVCITKADIEKVRYIILEEGLEPDRLNNLNLRKYCLECNSILVERHCKTWQEEIDCPAFSCITCNLTFHLCKNNEMKSLENEEFKCEHCSLTCPCYDI